MPVVSSTFEYLSVVNVVIFCHFSVVRPSQNRAGALWQRLSILIGELSLPLDHCLPFVSGQ